MTAVLWAAGFTVGFAAAALALIAAEQWHAHRRWAKNQERQ